MRETATGEREARADAPIVGSLWDSTTAQATRMAQAMRDGRERLGRGPAGASSEPHPAAQETRYAQGLLAGAP